jgi:hypothetical protein
MLVAASVCPHPPLLVPQVSVTEPGWLADLRRECLASVRRMIDVRPEVVAVVGTADATVESQATSGGSLRRYGVDARSGGSDVVLPLALTIGAWLLDEAGWTGPRTYLSLAADATSDECARRGAALGSPDRRIGLLVMGDGSAKRSTTAPGYYDPRAEGFDRAVVGALSSKDVVQLAAIDPDLADELWVAGRPAWQCLAGAASTATGDLLASARYDDAPRGVGYFVVDWIEA